MLARSADPDTDPVLVLRAAAAAAQAGLPLGPRTLDRLARCPPLPVPWPAAARDAFLALLGAGQAAVGVWEALDTEGLVAALLPDWERVRNRPQRNPLHTYTVDRHLVETAARAAALAREVARPDLLLVSAFLHDMGKGWPGDHSACGEVVARDLAGRIGFSQPDAAAGGGSRSASPSAAADRGAARPGRPGDGGAGRRGGRRPGAARAAARAGHRGRPGHRARRLERLEGGAWSRSWCAGCRPSWRASRRGRRRRGRTSSRWWPAAAGRAGARRRGHPGRGRPAGAALAGGRGTGLAPAGGPVGERVGDRTAPR